jgi:hypothetical protein
MLHKYFKSAHFNLSRRFRNLLSILPILQDFASIPGRWAEGLGSKPVGRGSEIALLDGRETSKAVIGREGAKTA